MSSQNLRLNFIGRNIDFIGKLENRSEKKCRNKSYNGSMVYDSLLLVGLTKFCVEISKNCIYSQLTFILSKAVQYK